MLVLRRVRLYRADTSNCRCIGLATRAGIRLMSCNKGILRWGSCCIFCMLCNWWVFLMLGSKKYEIEFYCSLENRNRIFRDTIE